MPNATSSRSAVTGPTPEAQQQVADGHPRTGPAVIGVGEGQFDHLRARQIPAATRCLTAARVRRAWTACRAARDRSSAVSRGGGNRHPRTVARRSAGHAAHLGHDDTCCFGRVHGSGDGAPHDQDVGTGRHRSRRRGDATLIGGSRTCRPDPGVINRIVSGTAARRTATSSADDTSARAPAATATSAQRGPVPLRAGAPAPSVRRG